MYSGLIVGELDSGSNSPGLNAGQDHCVPGQDTNMSLLSHTVPLITQEYKRELANS